MWCLLFSLLSAAVIFAQGTDRETGAGVHTEIDKSIEEWKTAYNSGNANFLRPLYAETARYVSAHVPGYDAIGREAVIANFQRGISAGGRIDSIVVLSVDRTETRMTLLTAYYATNNGIPVHGRNLLVMQRGGQRWEILFHMTAVKE